MYRELQDSVTKLGNRVLSERENSEEVLGWIRENPEQFDLLLKAFDDVIHLFNNSSVTLSKEYMNLNKTKNELRVASLPTIFEMIDRHDFKTLLQLGKTFRKLNGMMARGETTKEEPYVAYHTAKTNDLEALVVGSLFHFYEEHVLAHEGIPVERGNIEGALIETLSQMPTNPLWGAISERNRLNWIDNWSGFSEDFRNNLGFK